MPIDLTLLQTAVSLTLSLLLLVFVIQFVVVPTLVEEFRQRVFRARRELFLMAADGKIGFDHPAYLNSFAIMNGVLRFAERITFVRILLSNILCKKSTEEFSVTLNDSLKSVADEETRKKIAELNVRVGFWLVVLAFLTSPTAWLFTILVVAIGIAALINKMLGHSWKWIKDGIKGRISRIAAPIEAQAARIFDQGGTSRHLAMASDTKFFSLL